MPNTNAGWQVKDPKDPDFLLIYFERKKRVNCHLSFFLRPWLRYSKIP